MSIPRVPRLFSVTKFPRQRLLLLRLLALLTPSSSRRFEYSQLKECLAALDGVCAVDATEALETLSIYIDNIHKNPHDKKFRTIRISNIAFQERIGHLNGMRRDPLFSPILICILTRLSF